MLSGNHSAVIEDSQAEYSGNYLFTMVKAPGEQRDSDGRVIQSGETVNGTLPLGDLDVFTFGASAGDTITLAVGETVGSDSWFGPKLTLYGPDGAPLGSSWGSSGASVTRRTMLSGNHYAVIEDSQAEYSGNYLFTMVKAPGEQRDSDGRVIQSGETANGTLPLGDLDVFTFGASAGDTITAAVGETVGSDSWFGPKLTLYGPDGASLGSDWGSSGASVTKRTTLTGNHYAVIQDSEAAYSGNYWFRMTGATQPQIPWDSWEPFLTFPIPGYGPYANRLATAVFDHHSQNKVRHESVTTEEDDVVEAFNGERGEKRFGDDGSATHPGYQKDAQGTPVSLDGVFKYALSTDGREKYVQYDGHRGLDLGVDIGTPVVAAAAGRVLLTGPEIPSKPHLGFGNRVALQHPNGLVTIYAHLDEIDPAIQQGGEVADGAPIGKSGNTGQSYGPHLHFEVRIGGAAPTQPSIDPYGYRGSGVLWKSAAVHDCTCPAECAAGSGGVQLANPGEPIDLNLLRRFRDQVLTATPEGRALVDAFYANSAEVLYHMAADPDVFAGVRNAIASLQPTIRDLVDGSGQRIVAGTEVQAVATLAQQLLEPSGVVLRAALEAELDRIGSLTDLAGKSSTAVRQKVVGKFLRIVEPRLLVGGGFEFRVIGDAEASLRVESSDDLLTWKALDSPVLQQLPATVRDSSASLGGNRYYRVVSAP